MKYMKCESTTRICEELQVARPFYQAHHVGMSIFPPFRGFQHGNRLLLLLIIEIVLHLEQLPQWFLLQDDLRYGTPGFYGSFMLEVATRGPLLIYLICIYLMYIYIWSYNWYHSDFNWGHPRVSVHVGAWRLIWNDLDSLQVRREATKTYIQHTPHLNTIWHQTNQIFFSAPSALSSWERTCAKSLGG